MPIYDYTCAACRRVTEVIHGIYDQGPKFCPECGAEGSMTKAFVAPTVHFKGTGWAKKDRGTSARTRAREEKAGTHGEGAAAGAGSGSGADATTSETTKSDGGSSSASSPSSTGPSSTGGTPPGSGSSD